MKQFIALITLLFAAHTASATDAYNFKSLGFSKDGKHFAFIESVIQDGSGYAVARGVVVEVAKNQIVQDEKVIIEREYSKEKDAIKQVIRKLSLDNYNFNEKVTGRTLWNRVAYDLTDPALTAVFSTNYYVDGGASNVTPKYVLNLTEIDTPAQKDCFDATSKMISLVLSDMDGVIPPLTLQKDTKLPKSRYCPFGYEIRQVIENQTSIVVVLRYRSPGFEGPDYNHMVVTAEKALP